jgi:hypothetical protein
VSERFQHAARVSQNDRTGLFGRRLFASFDYWLDDNFFEASGNNPSSAGQANFGDMEHVAEVAKFFVCVRGQCFIASNDFYSTQPACTFANARGIDTSGHLTPSVEDGFANETGRDFVQRLETHAYRN